MEPLNIENLTLAQIRQIAAMLSPAPPTAEAVPHAYPVGQNVFIRTVTMHYTGHLVQVTQGELVLEDAAWIADSGRFAEALSTGRLHEVEPFPPGRVVVGRGSVVDIAIWSHALPRSIR